MKPLGRVPVRFPGKVDHHPGKGYLNWWEHGIDTANKARDTREWKKEAALILDTTDINYYYWFELYGE